MKKDLGPMNAVYPMPVLMIATYDENGKVDVMTAAWGMICDYEKIALFLEAEHKTTKNIKAEKAFTVSIGDKDHVDIVDFWGIASANRMEDKFERTGCHAIKSKYVNAPIIEEFPLVIECELDKIIEDGELYGIIGKIVNVAAEEHVLSENGKVDPTKLNALIFDQFQYGYYVSGEKVGKAWDAGKELMKDKEEEK
jgi:flavin reductase (DIM6/NTAB) family NADH-FMN oxidoreductase RutF